MRWGVVLSGCAIGGAIALGAATPAGAECEDRALQRLRENAKAGAWADVEQDATEAMRASPKRAAYAFWRGKAIAELSLRGTARWPEAKTSFGQAIALDPNRADAHFELAEVLLHAGDEQAALAEYTKAAELEPSNASYYGYLAELYKNLGFANEAVRTLTAGEKLVPDEAQKFPLYSLHGDILDGRRDANGALALYEKAKRACGPCTERGQAIAYFNLGAAYASVTPPRKSEAIMSLQGFHKMICKSALANRYADQCTQAQMLAAKLGGSLQ